MIAVNTIPETKEEFSAHIPALRVLTAMGWEYLSPPDCAAACGSRQEVILTKVLVEQLRKRHFEYKGKLYALSTNAIDQIVRELTAPPLHEGLLTANEKLYNKLTLGITVTEFVDGKKHSPTISVIDWDNP